MMMSFIKHMDVPAAKRLIAVDINNSYISSFTEFYPFSPELYYFSNFKDFNTITQA